jgi:F-type H+-transporting ATPase subunit b
VFGPVGQAIEKRRAQIATSIDEAESSRDEALRLLEDYRQRLAEARKEADELRERGRREGERARQELVSTAEQQRDRILTDSRTQLDAQQRQAMSDIRDDVVGLALLAAERVTRKSLSDDDHRRLVEQALDESDLSALSRGG